MADFTIVQDDVRPVLQYQLLAAGVPQDLTGATVAFQMDGPGGTPIIVDGACAILPPATDGVVQYQWLPADTLVPGVYEGEFHVVLPGGLPITFPGTRPLQIWIRPRLA